MRRKNLGEFLFSHFFVVPWKGFKKALKTSIKHFWGTTKNCENKNLHDIHFGILGTLKMGRVKFLRKQEKGAWTPWANLLSIWESWIYAWMGSHSLNIILCSGSFFCLPGVCLLFLEFWYACFAGVCLLFLEFWYACLAVNFYKMLIGKILF